MRTLLGRSVVAAAVTALTFTLAPIPTASAAAPPPMTCDLPAAGADAARAAPEQVGLDPAALSRAVGALSARLRLSVQVFRNNCLVATNGLQPVTGSVKNNLWSGTKSVVSMLTGIAAGDGALRLDDPIGKFLPTGPGWGDAAHRAITVRQLLDQTSGLRQAILSEAASTGSDPNLAREALAQPLVYEPGTRFQYSQLGPALLAYVVQRAVGQDLVAFAQDRLFGPIGIQKGAYFWLRDRSGLAYGFAHLFVAPAQFARLAQLMSNDGHWNGRQVVPAAYIASVSRPSDANGCYGLLFWTNRGTPCIGTDLPGAQALDRRMIPPAPADAYEMNGTGGQLAVMIPSLNMTVVTTGYFGNVALNPQVLLGAHPSDEMQWTFFRALMAAVQDADVRDPGPYPGQPLEFDLDPNNFLDPAVLADDLLTNPTCNVLICDGTVPTAGLLQNVQALPGLL